MIALVKRRMVLINKATDDVGQGMFVSKMQKILLECFRKPGRSFELASIVPTGRAA